jgi:predicted outer membrane repeat protein
MKKSILVFISLFMVYFCCAAVLTDSPYESAPFDIREDFDDVDYHFEVQDAPNRPEYAPNQIIIKFRRPIADSIENQLKAETPPGRLQISQNLDQLNTRYKVKSIKPLFKNFKQNRQNIKQLQTKNTTALTKQEKHLLRRLNRAPKGAKIPELDRIYKLELELEDAQSLEDVVATYNSDPDVEYAELNYIVSINLTPNDPLFSIQWALNNIGQMYPESGSYNHPPGTPDCDIDAPEAWDIYTGNSEIIVAVVDTGVDYNHRDLDNNMWTNASGHYGYDYVNDDTDPIDDHGHGTHCAGVIAAEGNNGLDITGLNWNAKIMALKFLDSSGYGLTTDATDAFYYAIENGADITSNSWGGGGYSQAAQDAINYAYSQGVIMVASAGNDSSSSPQYPAYYDNMFSVAATNSNDDKAPFSNYGSWVDIAAPGVDILSLRASGTSMGTPYDAYTTIASGTSMACPHVAGACALILSLHSEVDVNDLEQALLDSADSIDPTICASGRLNLYEAIASISTPKGRVLFNNNFYSCSDSIEIYLLDSDLTGNGSHNVTVSTDGNDIETVTLTETFAIGVFIGTIPTGSGDPNTDDGTVQLSHDNIMTVTYSDANDGTGNPAIVTDTATADCAPPVISNVQIDPIGPEPIVTFDTNEPTTGRLLYGLSCEEPNYIDSSHFIPATTHNIKLSGVSPETEYFFVIEANDVVDNKTIDDNNGACYTFTTTGPENIYVPADYNTIQQAIDISWDGGTVFVANGTYTGEGNCDIDFLGRAITVRSENGPQNCIIDCNGSEDERHRGFYFHSNEDPNSILDGLTITNGFARRACKPRECYYRGGGIYCYNSSPTIKNCIITNNTASVGGGVDFDGGSAIITNCTISNNSVFGTGRGGAIYTFSNATINNCIIRNNSSQQSGGAIYGSKLRINNCVIADNSAGGSAGGILAHDYTPDYSPSDSIITNCSIVDNVSGGNGGGILIYSSNTTVTNCILRGNSGEQMSLWSWPSDEATATVSYNNIENGEPGIFRNEGSTLNWGQGNIDTEPHFINPPPDEYSYHLLNDSPCIDAGSNSPEGGLLATDGDGKPRIVDGDNNGTAMVDMGPFEYDPCTMPPVFLITPSEIEFITPLGINPAVQTLSFRNGGNGVLDWSIEQDCPWLGVFPSDGNCTDEVDEITLTVDVNGLSDGMYSYPLAVSSNNAIYSPIIVNITLYVTNTLYVPSNYPTIQAAVDAITVDHFIVTVANGIYTGSENTNLNFNGKNIIVCSENGPQNCIIDCQNNTRAFTFDNGEDSTAILDGFTIKNGFAEDGGAIYCNQQSNPTIRNCIIADNIASEDGGGILSLNCSPTITDCLFIRNSTARFGGGIYAAGQSINISNCVFRNNSADRGGAILYQSVNNVGISNCIFTDNSATRGGGICYQHSFDMTITNCTFYNNSGSAAYLYWSTAAITNCIFWDNASYDIKLTDSSYNSTLTVSYTDMQAGQAAVSIDSGCTLNWGAENIDVDPLFVAGTSGDYYLSQTDAGQASNSPCVNAGSNTVANLGLNAFTTRIDQCPDEGIVDMGYHYRVLPIGSPDIDENRYVDLIDYVILASQWLKVPGEPSADIFPTIGGDRIVDMNDLEQLLQNWLDCYVMSPSSPIPENSKGNIDPNNILLSWSAGEGAINHDVYFGTSAYDVNNADHLSPVFKGTISSETYNPGTLPLGTAYYWRIDQVGERCTTKGPLWSFKTWIEPNLITWWKLDESNGTIAYDSAGFNDGTLINDPNWTTGQIDGALDFDGADDYVDCGRDTGTISFDASAKFTYSAWFKANGIGIYNWPSIIGDHSNGYSDGYDLYWYESIVYFWSPINGDVLGLADTGTLSNATWYHIVVTYDGTAGSGHSSGTLYLNGNPVDTYSETTFVDSAGNFRIGTFYSDSQFFKGVIDDIRIYDRALSAGYVLQLYNDGL